MRIILARAFIGVVILFNLQAAAVFLLWPERYITSFELEGTVGVAMLRGLGVLFVMWNVPYVVALWHPVHNRVSLFEALAMHIIGLVGEAAIYLSLPTHHEFLHASITRFIIFDAVGLLLLTAALLITHRSRIEAVYATHPTME